MSLSGRDGSRAWARLLGVAALHGAPSCASTATPPGGADAAVDAGPDAPSLPADSGCTSDRQCALLGAAAPACAAWGCDTASGACVTIPLADDAGCDDGDPCTVDDVCNAGACGGGHPVSCDDGEACTADVCVAGVGCIVVPLPEGFRCGGDGVCVLAACTGGACVAGPAADGTACDDGDPCTAVDACAAGACIGSGEPTCGVGGACEVTWCAPGEGCVVSPASDGVACDDGDPCTTGTACAAGICGGGGPVGCDDSGPCTVAVCVPEVGCLEGALPDGAGCEDGDPCTHGEACEGGACLPPAGAPCEDENPCTADTCETEGCSHAAADGGGCDDADPCTVETTCAAGICGGGAPAPCDDGESCTLDLCALGIGCVAVPLADGAACPDDQNPCTVDVCTAGACAHDAAAPGSSCDDGEACTGLDACGAEGCLGAPVGCDDGNPCTVDACLSAVGCVALPADGLPCAPDGDPCTLDLCAAGVCEHPATPEGAACDPGDPCALGGACQGGACIPSGTVPCDDGLTCTLDACEGGACVVALAAGSCLIGGVCHDALAPLPEATTACAVCDPTVSTSAPTFRAPCLYFGPGDVAALAAAAGVGEPSPVGVEWAAFLASSTARAEAIVASPAYSYQMGTFDYTFGPTMPALHPDAFPYWTAMFQEQRADNIAERINSLTFAWLLAGAPAYLELARGMVLDLCAWPQWTDPSYSCLAGPSCLDTAHAAMSVSLFLDAARLALAPEDRAAIVDCLLADKKGGAPLEAAVASYLGAGNVDSWFNGFALVAAGLAVTGATLVIDAQAPGSSLDDSARAKAESWLATGVTGAKVFFAGNAPDGGAFEGHLYGAYATDALVRVMAIADRHLGLDLAAPYTANVSRFAWSALAPDRRSLAAVGDSTLEPYWDQTMAYLAGRGDPLASGYLAETGIATPIRLRPLAWAWLLEAAPPAPPPSAPYASPQIGHAGIRSGWAGDDLALVFKCGPPSVDIDHNHYDAGSFVLGAGAEWVLADPGYRDTSTPGLGKYTGGSYGHSTWIVDGAGQTSRTGGTITGIGAAGPFAGVCGHFAATYAPGVLETAARCAFLLDYRHAVVTDHAVAAGPRDLDLRFQPPAAGVTTLDGDTPWVEATQGGVYLATSLEVPWTLEPAYQGVPGYPAHPLLRVSGSSSWTSLPQANPGFETADFTGWSPRISTLELHTIASDDCRTGASCAAISSVDAANDGYYYGQYQPATPGDRVRLEAWVKTTSENGGGAQVRIIFWKLGAYAGDCKVYRQGTGGWANEWVVCDVPDGVDQMLPALEWSGQGVAVFDDVTFAVDAPGEPLSVAAVHLVQYWPLPWGLRNPGFEGGLTHWTPRSPPAVPAGSHVAVSDGCPESATCGRIHFDAANQGYFYSDFISVAPGDTLDASALVRLEGSGQAQLRLLYYQGTSYAGLWTATPVVTSAPTPVALTHADVVPAGVDSLRIALELESGVGGATAWFDATTLASPEHADEVEPPQPPEVLDRGEGRLTTATDAGTLLLCAAKDTLGLVETECASSLLAATFAADLAILERDATTGDLARLALARLQHPELGATLDAGVLATLKIYPQSTGIALHVRRDGATLAIDAPDETRFSLSAAASEVSAVTLNGEPLPFGSADGAVTLQKLD